MRHAVCIVVDRLSAGFLGCYGNTWIDTPNFDRLASESTVFDQMFVDSPRMEKLYDAYWSGTHAIHPGSPSSLLASLKSVDVSSILLTDDAEVAERESSAEFDDRSLVQLPATLHAAEAAEQTHLAAFFAAAADLLGDLREPTMLWLHTGSLATTWDAPLEMRARYASEDDPDPYYLAEAPRLQLDEDYDPDGLLPYVHAYAGQVTLWDECLGGFLSAVDGLADNDTLLIVLGARGIAVGEHGVVGACHDGGQGEPLYEELVHVPCVLRVSAKHAATRSQQLVQPPDIHTTLATWFGARQLRSDTFPSINLLPLMTPAENSRTRAVVRGERGQWAIRTEHWFLRNTADGRQQLYAKPDDRWEVNDVADRCPEVVAVLSKAYESSFEGDWSSKLEFED